MRPIFEYIDYRKFLADYYQFKKETSRAFSYRYFSSKAGLTSPVYLKLVIDGKRNLSRQTIERFCVALQFNKKQSAYFRNLVLFDQAKTSSEKQEYYAVLRSMENAVNEKILGMDQYDYFSNWYNVVIRELVALYDFKQDFSLLARCLSPQISEREAREAVKMLENNSFIRKKADGCGYEQTDKAIATNGKIGLTAIRNFNKTMIEHSLTAIENIPLDIRHISGLTIGISPQMYDIIKTEVLAFKDRIVTLVNRDENCSRVYQLNIQLFPVSENVCCISSENGYKNEV